MNLEEQSSVYCLVLKRQLIYSQGVLKKEQKIYIFWKQIFVVKPTFQKHQKYKQRKSYTRGIKLTGSEMIGYIAKVTMC